MRSGIAVILAFGIVLSAAGAFASSQPVGGVATAQPGKIDVSVGYFYSKDKWDSNTLNAEGKVESNVYYGQIGYGVAPGWDVYFRMGAVDADGGGDLNLKSDGKVFAGAGFHGRLFEYKPWNLALGPAGNVGFYESWSEHSGNRSLKIKDHYSADIGFGFQWKPIKGFTFYGGPFYHVDNAELKLTINNVSDTANIHTKSNFGPRFGVNVMLSKDLYLQIEGQSRSYISGGACIGYNF